MAEKKWQRDRLVKLWAGMVSGLLLIVLASCGGGTAPAPTGTPTPTPAPTATPTPTPVPTATPTPLAQLCEHAATIVDSSDDVVEALEAFFETEPENLVPLLPEDKQDIAKALLTGARLAVQAGKLVDKLSPDAKEQMVNAVRELCN